MLVAVMAVPVMAATDTTDVTGTITATIEVDAPTSANLGDMEPTVAKTLEGGDITVTVKCNVDGWTLGAKEDAGDGKMSGTPGTLTNALKIKGGALTTYTALSGTDVMITPTTPVAGETAVNNVNFQQTTTWADKAGSYSITITFTALTPP